MIVQAGTVELRPGVRVWWSGEAWALQALDADCATLVGGDRRVVVSMRALAEGAKVLSAGRPADLEEVVEAAAK